MPANKVAHLKSVSIRPTSLDAPIGNEDGTEFGELVGDENEPNPFENLRSKSLIDDIKQMVDALDEREAQIIRLRFGLGGDPPKTLEEVGQVFKITRERVRQLQNIALSRMRTNLTQRERQRTAKEIHEEQRRQERMKVLQEFFETRKRSARAQSSDPG